MKKDILKYSHWKFKFNYYSSLWIFFFVLIISDGLKSTFREFWESNCFFQFCISPITCTLEDGVDFLLNKLFTIIKRTLNRVVTITGAFPSHEDTVICGPFCFPTALKCSSPPPEAANGCRWRKCLTLRTQQCLF